MITVKDILDKYNNMKINTKKIKEEFLNIELIHNMSIDDIEKLGYKRELGRNINTFVVDDIVISIYDNPMRCSLNHQENESL